jgi:hypothetical protein
MQVAAGLPAALWIAALFRHGASFGVGWIHPPELADPLLTLQNFVVGYGPEAWRWAATAAGAALAGLGFWRLRERRLWLLPALWLLLPPLVTWGLSLRRPAYVDRFLIGTLPVLMLAIAGGIVALWQWRRWAGLIAGLSIVAAMTAGSARLFDTQAYAREDWRGLAHHLSGQVQAGDVLLLRAPYYLLPFRYYYAGPVPPSLWADERDLPRPGDEAAGRLWLVYRGRLEDSHRFGESVAPDLERDETQPTARAWLEEIEPYRLSRTDFAGVAVWLYDFSAPQG